MMKILFAPAKTFNLKLDEKPLNYRFVKESNSLQEMLKSYKEEELIKHYSISDKLLSEVKNYIHGFDKEQGFEAISMFKGEAYKALKVESLSNENRSFLQENVYIVDALYGLLKPNDVIRPYRLDFLFKGFDLRSFWKDKINQALLKETNTVLSLASKEFSSLIDREHINLYEVTFYNLINGSYKAVSMYNKHHRGELLRFIIEHEIKDIQALPKSFFGYRLEMKLNQIEYYKD